MKLQSSHLGKVPLLAAAAIAMPVAVVGQEISEPFLSVPVQGQTPSNQTVRRGALTEAEVIQIAKEAYLYGYPLVDGYSVLKNYALDTKSPEYKAPLNGIGHARSTATPQDTTIIAPNVDTPYSHAWLDLRAGPVLITVPPFEKERYVSVQLIDLYTYITGYITPRTFGNEGGRFLVAGPDWKGEVPAGVRQVFRPPTQLLLAFFRTQLFSPEDLAKVHALQDQYGITPLAAPPDKITAELEPLNLRKEPLSPRFFAIMNWMLQFLPVLPEETALRTRFERIGIQPGASFQPDGKLDVSIAKGMSEALTEMGERAKQVKSSAEIFGSRGQLKDDYMARAVGAMLGIYGNSAEEYLGVGYQTDSEGQPFNGDHDYRIEFSANGTPPVGAFWSITVYNASRLLHENPLKRYVINSTMLPGLTKAADGSFTLYLQHESPGADKEPNWLPTPRGPMVLTFRTYLPGETVRTGQWQAPPVVRVR